MIRVVDLSPHQHQRGTPGPDFKRIADDGIDAVILRAFEGQDFDDVPGGYRFQAHREAAKDAGLFVGSYQLGRGRHDPARLARLYAEQLGELGPFELPPAIDFEGIGFGQGPGSSEKDRLTPGGARDWLVCWVDTMRDLIGRDPMVYVGPGDWGGWIRGAEFSGAAAASLARCAHWIAAYRELKNPPGALYPFGPWRLWQYTDKARIAGVAGPCDLSVWTGSLDDLASYCAGVSTSEAPTNPDGARRGALRVVPPAAPWSLDPVVDRHLFHDSTTGPDMSQPALELPEKPQAGDSCGEGDGPR